jgi:hypothetical protein
VTILLIIGSLTTSVGFLLMHPQLDKELASRFLYLGAGASVVTLSAFVIGLLPHDSGSLYLFFQFFFLILGVVHVLLIFRYQLLGTKFSGSPAFTTLLTAALSFVAAFGFNVLSKALVKEPEGMCATCVIPFAIPFLVYQSYRHWKAVPPREMPVLKFEPEWKCPTDDEEDMIRLCFSIDKKYTGLKTIRGFFERPFPVNWTLAEAFHETVAAIVSNETRVPLEPSFRKQLMTPAEWVLFKRVGWFRREYFDPGRRLSESPITAGEVVWTRRLRKLT